ncbi:MAG: metal-binding protein, partial [Halobacteriaceae archaeon]
MNCRRCNSPITRPGDYCLVCNTANCDGVVINADRESATLTMLHDESRIGSTTINTIPEEGDNGVIEFRNYTGRIADEVRRKRPETVFLSANFKLTRALRSKLHYDIVRASETDPVQAILDKRAGDALETVEVAPLEKIGGHIR